MAEKVPREVAEYTVVRTWERLIKKAMQSTSRKRFLDDADEIKEFYHGPHRKLFMDAEGWHSFEESAQVTVNKTSQYVRVVGPSLYNKNPTRTVTPKRTTSRSRYLSEVLSDYLNYTPDETNLRREGRLTTDESLICGMGVYGHEIDPMSGLVKSRYESCDNIEIDPDCERVEDAMWIARRRRRAIWEIEEEYGERAEGIRPATPDKYYPDDEQKGLPEVDEYATRSRSLEKITGESNHMVTVWEIWSRMGVGFRSKVAHEMEDEHRDGEPDAEGAQGYSDDERFKYMVIVFKHDRPLHIGPWPVPFHLDGEWPFTFQSFLHFPRDPWPIAPLKPALGIQKALDFVASFLLDKTKNHARNIVACDEDIYDELYEVLSEGADLPVVRFKRTPDGRGLKERIDWIQPPPLTGDLREVARMLEKLFEEQTGLTEILMGLSERAFRSAEEARMKDRNSRLTIEDMADEVEYTLTRCARKEALMLLYMVDAEDILKVVGREKIYGYGIEISQFGQPLSMDQVRTVSPEAAEYYDTPDEMNEAIAQVEQKLPPMEMGWSVRPVEVKADRVWRDVLSTMDIHDVAREMEYRIESGSARRPDKNWSIDMAQIVWERVGQMAMDMGDVDALHKILDNFYDTMGIPMAKRVYPEPQAPPPGEDLLPEVAQQVPPPAAPPQPGVI